MASRVGARNPAHSCAVGKVLLSYWPEEELDRFILEKGLPPRTANTLVDPKSFKEHLRAIRNQGYAVDDEENEKGIRCAGAPVFGNRENRGGRQRFGLDLPGNQDHPGFFAERSHGDSLGNFQTAWIQGEESVKKDEIIGGAVIFLFGGITTILSVRMPIGTFRTAGTGLFPLLLGIILMVLSLLFLINMAYGPKSARPKHQSPLKKPPNRPNR